MRLVVISSTRRVKNLQKVPQIFDFTAENAAENPPFPPRNFPRNFEFLAAFFQRDRLICGWAYPRNSTVCVFDYPVPSPIRIFFCGKRMCAVKSEV